LVRLTLIFSKTSIPILFCVDPLTRVYNSVFFFFIFHNSVLTIHFKIRNRMEERISESIQNSEFVLWKIY
jgi:hypothetical protein